jgi:predicted MFS family arabinose efflux permease
MVHATIAFTLMSLALTGALTPLIVLALVGMTGLVRPSDLGLRAALIADTIAPLQMAGAMGMSRMTTDSARIAGALTGAGLIATLGIGVAYMAIAAFYVAGVFLISRADSVHSKRTSKPACDTAFTRTSAWAELREGILYTWNTPSLMAIIWLVLLFNFTAFPLTNGLLPYVAKEIYSIDQAGLSYLIASISCGAVVGSIFMNRAPVGRLLPRLMITSAVIWHCLLLVFSQTEGFAIGIAILLVVGIFQSLSMVSLTVILMNEAGQQFRGRVMGVRLLAIYSLPIGLLLAGVLIDKIGFATTASIYASLGLTMTIAIAARWRLSLWPAK